VDLSVFKVWVTTASVAKDRALNGRETNKTGNVSERKMEAVCVTPVAVERQ
jgi:hypothetical protein